MRRYLHYLRKYYENFWFVNRVVWLIIIYILHVNILNSKQLLNCIISLNSKNDKISCDQNSEIYKAILAKLKIIDKLIEILPIKITCLVSSLVKMKILKKFSSNLSISLGIYKSAKTRIPHAELSLIELKNFYKLL